MRWIIILLWLLIFITLGCTRDIEKEQEDNVNILDESNQSVTKGEQLNNSPSYNPLLTAEENKKMNVRREKYAPLASITTQEQCETVGGEWRMQSPWTPEKRFCNLPTTDARKPCIDDSDCEGSCIVPLSDEEIYEIRHSRGDLTLTYLERQERVRKSFMKIVSKYKEGSCSELIVSDYCFYKFNNGEIEGCPIS